LDNFVFFTLAVAIIFTLIAGISYAVEPRRLLNGFLINVALAVDITAAGGLVIASGINWLIWPSAIAFIIIVGVIIIFFAFHLVWLIWNAIVVWRKERHTLGNMLTLLLAVLIVVIDIFGVVGARFLPKYFYGAISGWIVLLAGYIGLILLNFLTALVAYNLHRPLHNQDYLIVLGAGLLGGERVGRLLGARIDVAIRYYNKQKSKGRPTPVIIFSGGQGPDEKVSEASAMRQYAVDHGIPEEDTLLEDKSRTTLENMRFSAAIINELTGGAKYRAQFCTNNYHLFRAGLFAKQAGLNANGLGARTAFYYLPNATIREFAAIVMMNKRRHTIVVAVLSIIPIISIIIGLITHQS
jgi:uncharacterized SAM-binding protein YcdF (DUF218 family)